MPEWSLITVSYNSANDLLRFWKDFAHHDGVEWIVVDNCSGDDSVEVARRLGARVIPLVENLGFGAANNVGFRASRGEYVAFVNPDVTADAVDLGSLREHLAKHPLDLVSPQLVNGDGTDQPNGRGLPYLAYKIANRLKPEKLVGTYLRIADGPDVVECDWVMGAVVAGARERLAVLGPWDTRFFVYYEDSDLGLRNHRAGGRSVVLGSVRWLHGWARETTTASASAWRREIPSMVKFYLRYPRLLAIPRSLFGRPAGI
ncbi:glycosyltransferase [Microbacterium sp. SD291]|uniref:glycosyltransferase n=1 Tax=Microbacterium sp. SD291 TaxID=2782007 RepID=UPI001A978EB7|nr:glycosyltransferase [Microbacterium sp. SD291]MBO0980997.1 glycosyltransferase [Microbacterium sp. SD291]